MRHVDDPVHPNDDPVHPNDGAASGRPGTRTPQWSPGPVWSPDALTDPWGGAHAAVPDDRVTAAGAWERPDRKSVV